MNKQNWLNEAISYIDSLDTDEFEDFLLDCIPYHIIIDTKYSEITIGKLIPFPNTITANMYSYYTDDISIAA